MSRGIVQGGCALCSPHAGLGYKSLCVVVMICTTVANTQADKQTDRFQLTDYQVSQLSCKLKENT